MRDELSLLQAQLTYKKRLQAMLSELQSQRQPLQEKVAQLEAIMLREQKDVERLNERSLATFFYNVIGKMDEKLDTERREAYAARVKYDAAARELEAIEMDIRATEEDLQDLADCEERYAQAVEAKRLAIEEAHTPEAEALLDKENSLTSLNAQKRELEEAIQAGTQALHIIADLMQNLNAAKDWSALDRLGGSFLTEAVRHEKLDEAQKNVEELQVQLQRFNKELSDVAIRPELQLSIDKMLQFSDSFLRGLLMEADLSARIQESQSQVDQTREQILIILRQLQAQLEQVRYRTAKLTGEVDSMILNTEL